ncbi:MAG TPA: insulinase family protein, partial [Gemmatimonadales bacterium]
DIVVGNLATRPGNPDWYALTVLNKVLGGGTDSRLFQIIREQRSWTYDAHSGITRPRDMGAFSAGTETRTAVTDSALAETLKQLKLLRSDLVPDSEIVAAKGFLVGVFPLSTETPQQVASQAANVRLLGLGPDYLATYRTRVQAVTAADVKRAALRYVRPDSAVIVVVGDGALLYEKLAAIAPVKIVDPDGKALTPDDLKPKAAAVPWDMSQVVARQDSFGVVFQGQVVGYWTRKIASGDSLAVQQLMDISAAGATIRETTTLDRGTLRTRNVDQTSVSPRGTSEIHLVWAVDGRITGNVSNVPQTGGAMRTGAVDTTVAPPAIEASALGTFIEAIPLSAGASLALASYNPSSGKVDAVTVKVSDGGSQTVPAGTFDTWKVDVQGGDAPSTYWVAKAPRRLVRRAITGAPFTFDLIK